MLLLLKILIFIDRGVLYFISVFFLLGLLRCVGGSGVLRMGRQGRLERSGPFETSGRFARATNGGTVCKRDMSTDTGACRRRRRNVWGVDRKMGREWRIPGLSLRLYIEDLLVLSYLEIRWRRLEITRRVSLNMERTRDINQRTSSSSTLYVPNFQGSSSPSLPAMAARLLTVFGVSVPDFGGWFWKPGGEW